MSLGDLGSRGAVRQSAEPCASNFLSSPCFKLLPQVRSIRGAWYGNSRERVCIGFQDARGFVQETRKELFHTRPFGASAFKELTNPPRLRLARCLGSTRTKYSARFSGSNLEYYYCKGAIMAGKSNFVIKVCARSPPASTILFSFHISWHYIPAIQAI